MSLSNSGSTSPDKRNGQVIFSYKPLPDAEKRIYSRIADITISMKSTDHLKMPQLVSAEYPVRLSEPEYERYEELKRDLVLTLKDGEITAANATALSNKLCQMANGAVYGDDGGIFHIHDRKLDALEDLIEAANGKLEQVQSLRSLAEKATATLSDTPSGGTRNIHRMEDVIAKMIDLESEISTDLCSLIDTKHEIVTMVKCVECPELQTLLELRYLCFKTWEEIAVELHYDIRHVHRLHSKALGAIDAIRHTGHEMS